MVEVEESVELESLIYNLYVQTLDFKCMNSLSVAKLTATKAARRIHASLIAETKQLIN